MAAKEGTIMSCRIGILLLLVTFAYGCNRTPKPVVVNNTAPQPATALATPTRTSLNIDVTSYDSDLDKLRADTKALGADQAYETYYYKKLQETPSWGLKAEAAAPDFKLMDSTGKEITLAELRTADKPTLVYFYRGSWSPTSAAQLRWLASNYPALRDAGVQVVAITPEQQKYLGTLGGSTAAAGSTGSANANTPAAGSESTGASPADHGTPTTGQTASMARQTGSTAVQSSVPFPVLSDPGGTVMRSYGIGYEADPTLISQLRGYGVDLADRNGPNNTWLPVNSIYLLDRTGNVVWRSFDIGTGNGIDFRGALSQLQNMGVTNTGVRAEQSDAGDRSMTGTQAGDRAGQSDAGDRANDSTRTH
jgi:peroxiredoxin